MAHRLSYTNFSDLDRYPALRDEVRQWLQEGAVVEVFDDAEPASLLVVGTLVLDENGNLKLKPREHGTSS